MKNESRIRIALSKNLDRNIEKEKYLDVTEEIKTSVDFSLEINEINFLFEIDSNNAVKIIFGQYLLLNKVKTLPKNPFLIIIHCFENFNKNRTIKHLKYAKDVYKCKIPFAVLTENDWIDATLNKSKKQITNYLVSLTKQK
jgi:hypothetical protein